MIFTCGGTAGHVNPALALAGLLRERRPDSRVLFVGAHRGIEKKLIEDAGWPFRAVEVSNFHRSLRPREIRHNLVSLRNFLRSPGEARRLLEQGADVLALAAGAGDNSPRPEPIGGPAGAVPHTAGARRQPPSASLPAISSTL